MTKTLHLLQLLSLIILWGDISLSWWFGLAIAFFILYCAGKTHRNAVGYGPEVEKFWFRIAGLVFIIDIISVLTIYIYILY